MRWTPPDIRAVVVDIGRLIGAHSPKSLARLAAVGEIAQGDDGRPMLQPDPGAQADPSIGCPAYFVPVTQNLSTRTAMMIAGLIEVNE